MKVVLTVDNCSQCPHRRYGSGGGYDCAKVDAPLCKGEALPEWCPLPNDPAPVAARARKAIQNASDVLTIALAESKNPETSPARLRELIKIAHEQIVRR